jgi:hypothetical protein
MKVSAEERRGAFSGFLHVQNETAAPLGAAAKS